MKLLVTGGAGFIGANFILYWMRKHPDDEEYCKKLGDNLHISDDSYEKYLLIRNIKNYPKTYIIVKVIRFKK